MFDITQYCAGDVGAHKHEKFNTAVMIMKDMAERKKRGVMRFIPDTVGNAKPKAELVMSTYYDTTNALSIHWFILQPNLVANGPFFESYENKRKIDTP